MGMFRRSAEQRARMEEAKASAQAEKSRRYQLAYSTYRDGQYPGLSVTVQNGDVCGWHPATRLGPLAGAQAGVSAPARAGAGTAVSATVAFGVAGAAGALAGGKSFAYVIFPDGRIHTTPLHSAHEAQRAQADALRFNAIAAQVSG